MIDEVCSRTSKRILSVFGIILCILVGAASGGQAQAAPTTLRTYSPRVSASHKEQPFVCVPSCHGNSNSNVTNYQGFDACYAPSLTTSQMSVWWNDSYYAWVGFYLGGPNDPNCSVATSSWISTIQTQGWSVVPIYDGLAAPCATNNSLNMSYDTNTAFSQGENDAKQAENTTSGLGLQSPIIYEDMEPFDQYNSSCNAAVSAYASGWTTQLNNDGYLAGLYEYYANVPALVSGASNMPLDIYISNGGCSALKQSNSCTVWNVSGISNGWFLNDQRLYQYAFNFSDCYPAGQNCLNVDADATSGLVYGVGGGDSDPNAEIEGSGAQSSDP